MSIVRSFAPRFNATVNISVGATSSNVYVGKRNGPITVRIVSDCTSLVWLSFGDATVSATTATGIPIGPGVHEVMTFAPSVDGSLYIAAICTGSFGKIYFTMGEGL